MQYISKAFLKLLSLLIVVVQLFLLLGSIAVVIASGAMFFVNGEAKYELYKYVLGPNNITIPMLLFSCLVALIIVISLILILHSLRKIINNIYSEDYFVESNLINVRKILIYALVFLVSNILSMFTFSNLHEKNISNVFANSWNQIMMYVVFLVIMYIIYLIFKRGISLKHNSSKMI